MTEDREWQRLDKWLWCARFLKARAACARLVAEGMVRINRQPTDKPHARLRPGDVVTLPLRGDVRVVRVLGLAARRGPAAEAGLLYEELEEELGESGALRPRGLHASSDGGISAAAPAAANQAGDAAEDPG